MTCADCTFATPAATKPGWHGVYCPVAARNLDAGNQACDPVVQLVEARAQIVAMAQSGFETDEEGEYQ